MYPPLPGGPRHEKPVGYSYAGVVIGGARDDVLAAATDLHFSGWVGPEEDGWVVLVPGHVGETEPGGDAGLERVAAAVADRLDARVLAAAVHHDRLLRLAAWSGAREVAHYVSNPAVEAPDDEDAFPGPAGAEHADALVRLFRPEEAGPEEPPPAATVHVRAPILTMDTIRGGGEPSRLDPSGGWEVDGDEGADDADTDDADLAEELGEVLGEVLDEDTQIESERLGKVLDLLGLPRWLVAVSALPKHVPSGPGAEEFTPLVRGHAGVTGKLYGWVAGRRRHEG